MEIRSFYQKVREVEQTIAQSHVVVISQETPDGGRAGMATEVAKTVAARLVVEGAARIATADEAALYRSSLEAARQQADQKALAAKVQLAVLSESDVRALRTGRVKG